MPEIRAATFADADQVFELLDARSRAAFGASEVSRRRVVAELRRSVADRLVAVADERMVGYAHLTPTNGVVVAASDAATGDELLARVERLAGDRGADAIEAAVAREDVSFRSLVERNGFVQERLILRMWRVLRDEPEAPTWPRSVTMRTYDDADASRVKALLDGAYRWDPHYAPLSFDEWIAYMTDHDEFDRSLWFVVERRGEIVACALHWKEHDRRGWLKDLAVHESARGEGIGKSLVRHGLHAYRRRGVERVGLKVDAANPTGAVGLYERLGFVADQHLEIWRKTP